MLKLLGDDMSYRDETAVPASELQRRDELQKIKYYARILMNGQVGTGGGAALDCCVWTDDCRSRTSPCTNR